MALFLLVVAAITIGFAAIALARGGARAASSERDRALLSKGDEIDRRLADMEIERLQEIVLRLLDKIGLEIVELEAVDEQTLDVLARDPRPLLAGDYLVQCTALGDGAVDGPQVVALADALRAAGANKGILVTTGFFSDDALRSAQDHPLELVGRRRLRELLFEQQLLVLVELD